MGRNSSRSTLLTTIGFIPALLIVGILFIIGAAAIFLLGLVSALIYGLAAVGIIALLNLLGFINIRRPWTLLLFLIIPIMMLWGYGTDHIQGLSLLSPAQFLSENPTLTINQMDIQGEAIHLIMTPQAFGAVLVLIGIICTLLIFAKTRKSKSRR